MPDWLISKIPNFKIASSNPFQNVLRKYSVTNALDTAPPEHCIIPAILLMACTCSIENSRSSIAAPHSMLQTQSSPEGTRHHMQSNRPIPRTFHQLNVHGLILQEPQATFRACQIQWQNMLYSCRQSCNLSSWRRCLHLQYLTSLMTPQKSACQQSRLQWKTCSTQPRWKIVLQPQDLQPLQIIQLHCAPFQSRCPHQNGFVKRANQTINDILCAMLTGAKLDACFWPHTFDLFLLIKHALPTATQTKTLHEFVCGLQADPANLCMFDCWVWIFTPRRPLAKLNLHAANGFFLGHLPHTTENTIWFDPARNHVEIACNVRFDEGMNNLFVKDIYPKAFQLFRAQDGICVSPEDKETAFPVLQVSPCPFADVMIKKTVTASCNQLDFGITLHTDKATNRAHVLSITNAISRVSVRSPPPVTFQKFIGSFLLAVNDTPVFTCNDASAAFAKLQDNSALKFTVSLVVAPLPAFRDCSFALKDCDHFGVVCNNMSPESPINEKLDDAFVSVEEPCAMTAILHTDDNFSDVPHDVISCNIHVISSHHLTPEEHSISCFTCKALKKIFT